MPQVIKPQPALGTSMDRAAKRGVNRAVNAAIHQLQLADEATDEHAVVRARGNLKQAREAIDEALRLLKA